MTREDRRLFWLLDRAGHAVRERIDAMCRSRLGITAPQLGALLVLGGRDEMRHGELAAALGVRPAAVTGMVDRMEAAGLVRRRAVKDDGRGLHLALTAQGRRALDEARPLIARANARLAAQFTDDELAIVSRFLRAVADLDLEGDEP